MHLRRRMGGAVGEGARRARKGGGVWEVREEDMGAEMIGRQKLGVASEIAIVIVIIIIIIIIITIIINTCICTVCSRHTP